MKTAAAPEEEMTLHPCLVLFGLPIYCDDDGDKDIDDPLASKGKMGFVCLFFATLHVHS